MATEIPLNHGKVAMVDDEDAALASQWRWHANKGGGKIWYANGRKRDGDRKLISMHRLVMGNPIGKQVDHRDGDGLNNRRSNLRISNRSQNFANKKTFGSRSGYKGVILEKRSWRASISAHPQRAGSRTLGNFSSPEEAARAYDDAARERWGEFACVNFPRPGERSALTGEIEPELPAKPARRRQTQEAELIDAAGE